MGFNNYGAEAMARRLDKTYPKGNRLSPLGINIGKAKTTSIENTLDDYLKSIDILTNQQITLQSISARQIHPVT